MAILDSDHGAGKIKPAKDFACDRQQFFRAAEIDLGGYRLTRLMSRAESPASFWGSVLAQI